MITIERVTKFTVDKLLAMAADAEAKINSWPNGTPRVDGTSLSDLHRVRDEALACAIWMEKNGHSELEYVGPFGEVCFERGDKVRVKAGAKLASTNPKYSRAKGGKVAGRTYQITVNRASPGYVLHGEVHQPEVHWAGEGCYWFWTDLNNVEPV